MPPARESDRVWGRRPAIGPVWRSGDGSRISVLGWLYSIPNHDNYMYIVACQAHPALVKIGPVSSLFNFNSLLVRIHLVKPRSVPVCMSGLVHLIMD